MAFAQGDASGVVKKITKSFRDKKNAEIIFDYHYEMDSITKTEVQEGTAYLQGESYKILQKEQQTVCDGTTIWTYLIEEEEVVISSTSFGDDNTPLKLLTSLDKYYKASFINETTIMLVNPEGQFKLLFLTIDPKKNTLKGIDYVANDGSKMVIEIKELKYEQDLKDDFFTFDVKAYPEVDVIDMR
jgi:outer membrane lipoprotein-sorting protein